MFPFYYPLSYLSKHYPRGFYPFQTLNGDHIVVLPEFDTFRLTGIGILINSLSK